MFKTKSFWINAIAAGMSVGIIGAILFPVLAQHKDGAPRSKCLLNIHALSSALLMYGGDNDDRFPLAANWMDALSPVTHSDDVFHCPSLKTSSGWAGYGYAFNKFLSGSGVPKGELAEKIPVVWDSQNLSKNANEFLQDFPSPARHRDRAYVGFADSHVRVIPTFPKPN